MSALGHKRTFCDVTIMSALPRKHVLCTTKCLPRANSGPAVKSCKFVSVKQRLGANHATWHLFRSCAATDDDPIFGHFRRGCFWGESSPRAYSVSEYERLAKTDKAAEPKSNKKSRR